jgi:hypothetical protein
MQINRNALTQVKQAAADFDSANAFHSDAQF